MPCENAFPEWVPWDRGTRGERGCHQEVFVSSIHAGIGAVVWGQGGVQQQEQAPSSNTTLAGLCRSKLGRSRRARLNHGSLEPA